MSTGAIIFMIIGCTLLWGGFIVACIINFKCSRKEREVFVEGMIEEFMEAESESKES